MAGTVTRDMGSNTMCPALAEALPHHADQAGARVG
jgi:hypothetical protein